MKDWLIDLLSWTDEWTDSELITCQKLSVCVCVLTWPRHFPAASHTSPLENCIHYPPHNRPDISRPSWESHPVILFYFMLFYFILLICLLFARCARHGCCCRGPRPTDPDSDYQRRQWATWSVELWLELTAQFSECIQHNTVAHCSQTRWNYWWVLMVSNWMNELSW